MPEVMNFPVAIIQWPFSGILKDRTCDRGLRIELLEDRSVPAVTPVEFADFSESKRVGIDSFTLGAIVARPDRIGDLQVIDFQPTAPFVEKAPRFAV
jgi:hypothetical protein